MTTSFHFVYLVTVMKFTRNDRQVQINYDVITIEIILLSFQLLVIMPFWIVDMLNSSFYTLTPPIRESMSVLPRLLMELLNLPLAKSRE